VKEILFNYIPGNPVPVPYYVGGEVHMDLHRFLTRRFYHPSRIEEGKKTPTKSTITNLAINIRYLFNILAFDANVEDERGEVVSNITYLTLEYFHLKQILKSMYDDWDIKGQSLQVYVQAWRQFYDFLDTEGIQHNMVFEGKQTKQVNRNIDDDFLSHRYNRDTTYEVGSDLLIEPAWMEYSDDYKSSVISMDQYYELWDALYEDDPVYAVMAGTMMQTFLRVGGVVQMPLTPNGVNKNWKRYVELSVNETHQMLKYRNKGGKIAKCLVHKETMRLIHEEYIIPFRSKRQELFKNNYSTSIHAIRKGVTSSDNFLWLNKYGTPVTIKEIQSAFLRAQKKLGFKVTCHFMRHTGATQLLYFWGLSKGTDICEHHKTTIHSFLKRQLGHSNIETTLYYIRTIENLIAEEEYLMYLPNAIPANKRYAKIAISAQAAYKEAMDNYESRMTGT
jgi:integrase